MDFVAYASTLLHVFVVYVYTVVSKRFKSRIVFLHQNKFHDERKSFMSRVFVNCIFCLFPKQKFGRDNRALLHAESYPLWTKKKVSQEDSQQFCITITTWNDSKIFYNWYYVKRNNRMFGFWFVITNIL